MIKIYEKIQKFIKENFKIFVFYTFLFLIFTVHLPYYISAPGGLIDTKDRVDTAFKFKLKGSLNMAYVTEIHASIPTYLWSLIQNDWDLEKASEAIPANETEKDTHIRNNLLLDEANKTAELIAYKYSNIDYKIENDELFITYVDESAKTDLKVGDEITYVDGAKVTGKEHILDYIRGKKIGDKITFKVINNKKELTRKATILDIGGEAKVGVIVTEKFDIKSDSDIKFNFSSSESGPSGGLMTTLTIYSYINKIDLTHGRKIAGTGTIEYDGTVGEIGGVKYKFIGAVNNKADVFLVPKGDNYEEVKKIKKRRGYKIDIIPVGNFEDALKYLYY